MRLVCYTREPVSTEMKEETEREREGGRDRGKVGKEGYGESEKGKEAGPP